MNNLLNLVLIIKISFYLEMERKFNCYLEKYQVATAPEMTICWHARINSDVQISPITWYHHIYLKKQKIYTII